MADRVAVLRGGELQQLDTPQQVYVNPANLFVAVFIGSPAMNVVEGRARPRGRGHRLSYRAIPGPRSRISSSPRNQHLRARSAER